MKKFLFFFSIAWVAFLCLLVFKDRIIGFFEQQEKPPQSFSQKTLLEESAPPQKSKDTVVQKSFEQEKEQLVPAPMEGIPFAPLEENNKSEMALVPQIPAQNPSSNPTSLADKNTTSLGGLNLSDPFGLILTKFERQPSRFRLVSWKGSKKVQIEDLKKYNSSKKVFPKHWIEIGQKYVEWLHPSTKESFFKPAQSNSSSPRFEAISFEVRNQVLSFSGYSKPIGYLILRDFKFGGPPYEITSEMNAPLTSSYAIHCQQHVGANKYFHDLSGKRKGFKFGGWGVQFTINKFDFPERKLTVIKKDLKSKERTKKVISTPYSSL